MLITRRGPHVSGWGMPSEQLTGVNPVNWAPGPTGSDPGGALSHVGGRRRNSSGEPNRGGARRARLGFSAQGVPGAAVACVRRGSTPRVERWRRGVLGRSERSARSSPAAGWFGRAADVGLRCELGQTEERGEAYTMRPRQRRHERDQKVAVATPATRPGGGGCGLTRRGGCGTLAS